jgi:hypothetical protein
VIEGNAPSRGCLEVRFDWSFFWASSSHDKNGIRVSEVHLPRSASHGRNPGSDFSIFAADEICPTEF